jgi:hypothetical protein
VQDYRPIPKAQNLARHRRGAVSSLLAVRLHHALLSRRCVRAAVRSTVYGMTQPAALDESLVADWFDVLAAQPWRGLPADLIDGWRAQMLAAVREAREPATLGVIGKVAPLDHSLSGLAAGIAAGLATSAASDGVESDPVIFTTGLLAGAAALSISNEWSRETEAARAAAASVVDIAADGRDLDVVITAAARGARRGHSTTGVAAALDALAQAARTALEHPASGQLFDIQMQIESRTPESDLDLWGMSYVIEEWASRCDWVPVAHGYRLMLQSSTPGPLILAMLPFGQVTDLRIDVIAPPD